MTNAVKTFLIIVSVLAVFTVPYFSIIISDINSERNGCERLDETRIALFNFLNGARETRLKSAKKAKSKEERKIAKNAVKEYEAILNGLISSTAEFATERGSVHVDCKEAYPYPWPFSLVIGLNQNNEE